jgi:integrase
MGRVKDLWWTTGERGPKRKTARHPDSAGKDAKRRKQLQNARRWLAIWVDPGGRERTEAFSVRKNAEGYATKMTADVERGEYLDPALGKALVAVLARKWLALQEVGAGSRRRYETCYRLHVAPKFGTRAAGGVQPSEIADWSKAMAGHPVTRQHALMILTGVFDLAVADGVRRDNPARSPVVPSVTIERVPREPWPVERVLAVAPHCGLYHHVPLIAAGLGLRIAELLGLAAEDIDLAARMVTVSRQVACEGGRWYFKLPKGGKTRQVPLSRGVEALVGSALEVPTGAGPRTLLERIVAANRLEPVTLPWLAEDGTEGRPRKAMLLFRWHDGRHVRPRSWDAQVWKPALVAAGLMPAPGAGGSWEAREFGMHALRHWYSTTLQDAGVSLAGVMEFMGHSRKSMPLAVGVYGHVTPETVEAARNAIDRSLFRLRIAASDGTVTELRRAQ